MKVFFVGANGKVARHFADFVKNDKEIEEIAMIRNENQADFFKERGIKTALLDLVDNTVEELAEAMKESDADAIVFSAGAGGSGFDKTVMIDLDGAVKVMTAAEQAGVNRFVMVSTFQTGRQAIQNDNDIKVYTIAKTYADEWLKNQTNLDWTIVHPGILTNEAGTGKIEVGMGQNVKEVSRQDVAQTLIEVLRNPNTIKQEFEVLKGDTPIAEAVHTLK